MPIVRIKNRFARANKTAKESGGYRDLQLVAKIIGTSLLIEIQLHLKAFYQLKSEVGTSVDAGGQTGHERYIEFRGIKEQVRLVHLVPNAQGCFHGARLTCGWECAPIQAEHNCRKAREAFETGV